MNTGKGETMAKISAIGKYLDQPLLISKLNKSVPYILSGFAGGYLINDVHKTPKEERRKKGLKTAITLFGTILSAIAAPKIASKLTKRNPFPSTCEVINRNKVLVNNFISENPNTKIKGILEKSKNKVLSLYEVSRLFKKHKEFANKLIPPPENIQAKDIFKEIGYLSIFGAIPVAGGITGGIIADKVTDKGWKEKVPDKINEGIYQYLANIFLCNIGAGTALGILEKMNIKSKAARCIGMIAGIITTGVIGGSAIANFIGNKIVNPIILKKDEKEKRTPELLDLSLHADDIATVSLLSGLKWIEPALPILYSISGYRAGIGYRNNS